MLRITATLFMIVINFVSCKQNSNNAELNILIQGFDNANKHTELSNMCLYTQFEQHAAEPAYRSFGIEMLPKSRKIKEYSSTMIREIDVELEKNALQVEPANHDLYDKLLNYKRNLINILDPVENAQPAVYQNLVEAKRRLYSEMPVLAFVEDTTSPSTRSKSKQRFDSLFNNSNSLMQKAFLYKIKNDILLSEYSILFYFLSRHCFLPSHYDEYGILASLNSTYFRAGDTIELSAGMARFSGESSPRISVNGKELELKGYGQTNHIFQARGIPGKYSLKVNFEYYEADGVKQSATKNLHYTILP